jgi:hypothetical protein
LLLLILARRGVLFSIKARLERINPILSKY